VLDAFDLDGTQLVLLRNPWGSREFNGEWSDYDLKNWTERRKRLVEERQKIMKRERIEIGCQEDGSFWMSFEKFTKYFNAISIVRLYDYPEWKK
jgi:hypothetical protein